MALAMAALACLAPAAAAQEKLALVVANESYAADVGDAGGALASAAGVGGALGKAGFDVSTVQNVDRAMLEAMVNALAAKARGQAGKCTVVFYYAGHAASVSSGRSDAGVLVLKNAKGGAAAALLEDAVAVDSIIGALTNAGCAGGVFAAIDGARGNLAEGLGAGVARGLSAPGEHRETAILYSTSQGATATNDGALGRALAGALAAPDQTMSAVFKNAVRGVADATGRRRVPYLVDNVLDPACVTCGLAAVATKAAAPAWSAKVETGRQRAGDRKQYLDADGEFDGEKFGAAHIAVAPGGSVAATGYKDGAVEIWNPANGELRASFRTAGEGVYRLAWSNDGALLAVADLKGAISVWKADGGKVRDIDAVGTMSALAFDASGQNLLVNASLAAQRIPVAGGGASWEANLSPTDINAPVRDMMGSIPSQSVWAGDRLVWATMDGRFRSIRAGDPDLAPLAPVAACTARGDGGFDSPCGPIGIAASADGKRIAVARRAGTVSLLDGSGNGLTDREIRICKDASMCLSSGLTYLPVLDAFATLSFDTGLRIWSAATGEPMGGAPVRGVVTDMAAFESGGKQYLAIALYDGTSAVASLAGVAQ